MSTVEHPCEAARAKAWRLATVSCVMLLPLRTSFSSFATWSSRSAALARLQDINFFQKVFGVHNRMRSSSSQDNGTGRQHNSSGRLCFIRAKEPMKQPAKPQDLREPAHRCYAGITYLRNAFHPKPGSVPQLCIQRGLDGPALFRSVLLRFLHWRGLSARQVLPCSAEPPKNYCIVSAQNCTRVSSLMRSRTSVYALLNGSLDLAAASGFSTAYFSYLCKV